MNKKLLKIFIPSLLLSASIGCSITIKSNKNINGFTYSDVKEKKAAFYNFNLLKEKYGREWQFNKKQKNLPPQLGLAMSGGGIRSAAFNIGVLTALNETGTLNTIDVMSAVSGGSYAMSWYYLQQYYSGEEPEIIFDFNERFQKHLENNAHLSTHSSNPVLSGTEALGKFVLNAFAAPFHIIANGVFDWNLNLSPNRMFYENGIEREFHLAPEKKVGNKKSGGYTNSASILGITVGVKDEVMFPEIKEFIQKKGLPYFIINTTVAIGDDMEHQASQLSNSIFEFTPLRYGSDSFGYSEDFPFSVGRAVSISGAAADSSVLPNPAIKLLYSAANLDLGYYAHNYNITTGEKIFHSILPFPFYFSHHYLNDSKAMSIYLSDGGHSENLAAFSLIRRLCREIIIVDAEHDPDYGFASYWKLKNALKREMNVDFELPGVEVFNGSAPVLRGTISWFPVENSNGDIERMEIDVTYVKLSIDSDKAGKKLYPGPIQNYYDKHKDDRSKLLRLYSDPFPQQPTADIFYSDSQFKAYRDLGYFIVKNYF